MASPWVAAVSVELRISFSFVSDADCRTTREPRFSWDLASRRWRRFFHPKVSVGRQNRLVRVREEDFREIDFRDHPEAGQNPIAIWRHFATGNKNQLMTSKWRHIDIIPKTWFRSNIPSKLRFSGAAMEVLFLEKRLNIDYLLTFEFDRKYKLLKEIIIKIINVTTSEKHHKIVIDIRETWTTFSSLHAAKRWAHRGPSFCSSLEPRLLQATLAELALMRSCCYATASDFQNGKLYFEREHQRQAAWGLLTLCLHRLVWHLHLLWTLTGMFVVRKKASVEKLGEEKKNGKKNKKTTIFCRWIFCWELHKWLWN